MAEQVGHNVVENFESAGALAPADVHANQSNIDSADDGTTFPETKTDSPEIALSAHEHAAESDPVSPHMSADIDQTAQSTAEPSAGDVIDNVTGSAIPDGLESEKDTSGYAQLVNGTYDVGDVLDDGSIDAGQHSDPEGSGGDAVKDVDEKHHVRTNSVKKPTTFNKVSVTKNFLAKSVTVTPPAVKPGEKPSPVGTPPLSSVARPRLIAKTGTSLRDVQKARVGAETAGGPDASKVWNKNRPVAPPPPKQFTDEELKQQYGIHLATRLQTDENGKESKWADIDDDEDDWAPDTVVWMDGTKSTLAPHETPVSPPKEVKEPSTSAAQPTKPAEGVRPTLAAKSTGLGGPTKTILKPGASTAAAQAKQSESGLGTPTDKSSLTAKSPSAVPSKSPWAALPPIDKVSPLNPPVQQKPPQLLASQDARAYEQPPPQPAREIAADTFDRSWREGEGGARELFNSTNGRYEPVQEGRRGSMKPESASRKPALLQRPSQSSGQPAEPSAAFQTRSTTQTDGPYSRRRGSSVGQGSIPPARRVSVSKTLEASPAPERRSSTVIGHDMRSSPRTARNEPAQPMFSQQSAWQQQMPPQPESETPEPSQPEPTVEGEDPVKVQERVMREKRELAKQRRKEEEARLEAEKKERLQARLALLEGAGKSRKEREAEAAAAVAAQTPSSEKAPDSAGSATTPAETKAQPTNPAETSAMAAPVLEAQSVASVPEALRPTQPTPEERLPSPLPPKPQTADLPERPISSTDQNQRQPPKAHLSPRANARAPFQQSGAPYRPPASSYSSPGERKQQPFGRSPIPNNEASSLWPTTAPNGNVWGSSGIGNGTFETSNLFAPMPVSQQGSALPPPPGMARPPGSTRISPQSLAPESRSPNLQQSSVAEQPRGFGPPGLEPPRPDAFASQGRVSGTSPAPGLGRQAHLPGPIAPPSRAQQQQPSQRQDPISAWNNAANRLPYQYKSEAEAAETKAKEAVPSAPRQDTIRETFRQTSAQQGKLGAPRKYDRPEYTVHDAQGSRSVQSLSPAPPSAQTQPSGPFSTASPNPQDPSWSLAGENTVRIPDPSLNPAHGGLPTHLPPIGRPPSQQSAVSPYQANANYPVSPLPPAPETKEQSPPPPETSDHPVNSGGVGRPLVRLPHAKPKVKLPPAQAQTPAPHHTPVMAPPQRPLQTWTAPGSARPIVMQEAWQARFNGLFNRPSIQIPTETPPSPPKTPPKAKGPALAVASSSRAVMDEAPSARGATVSLPQFKKLTSPEGFTLDDSEDAVSRSTIEQMFNAERSFGSLPKVALPRNPRYDRKVYTRAPYNMLGVVTRLEIPTAVEPASIQEFNMKDLHAPRREGLYVHIPHLRLIRRLVRRNNGSRKPSATHQERKPSGKFKPRSRETTPNPPVTNSPANNSVRKPSFQRGGSTTPNPPATYSPANDGGVRKPSFQRGGSNAGPKSPATTSSSANESSRKSSWVRPPRGRGRGQASTVKAT